jgi:3-oxoacyl-[acyl-carrier protein] reductase
VVNYPWPSQRNDALVVLEKIKQGGGLASGRCIVIEADLSTKDGPKHLVDETVRQMGCKVDILVNNAGIAIMKPLEEITPDQWDKQVNLNARGTMLLTQAVLPHLNRNSRIVSVSSVGARQGYVGATIYNGTKSMVESFTRCWAL